MSRDSATDLGGALHHLVDEMEEAVSGFVWILDVGVLVAEARRDLEAYLAREPEPPLWEPTRWDDRWGWIVEACRMAGRRLTLDELAGVMGVSRSTVARTVARNVEAWEALEVTCAESAVPQG